MDRPKCGVLYQIQKTDPVLCPNCGENDINTELCDGVKKSSNIGECPKHGEYYLGEPDWPCPSCEDEP